MFHISTLVSTWKLLIYVMLQHQQKMTKGSWYKTVSMITLKNTKKFIVNFTINYNEAPVWNEMWNFKVEKTKTLN